jgi:hypothetical protein
MRPSDGIKGSTSSGDTANYFFSWVYISMALCICSAPLGPIIHVYGRLKSPDYTQQLREREETFLNHSWCFSTCTLNVTGSTVKNVWPPIAAAYVSIKSVHVTRGGIFSLDRVRTCFEVCTLSEKGYDPWEKMPLKQSHTLVRNNIVLKKTVHSTVQCTGATDAILLFCWNVRRSEIFKKA